MNNPFVFGEIVSDEAFCDREEEHAALVRDLSDSQKLFLISSRRYGKTSLLKKVLKTLEGSGIIPVYVDLYRASSIQSFLGLYCGAIAQAAESTLDKAVRFVRDVLPRLRPRLTIDSDGAPSIGIEPIVDKKDLLHALDEAYEFPSVVAKRKKKRVAVVFDEFQEIINFNGESIEKVMRSHIQEHRMVGYVFSGSKKHILEDMTLREDRAFYKIGKIIYLQKIERRHFAPFLKERFENYGFSIDGGVIDHILDVANDIPYNAQFLCHELWDRFRDANKFSSSDANHVFSIILDEQSPFFIQQWDTLSLNQRAALKTIVDYSDINVFSQEFLIKSGIGSLPTLQTSLKLLVKKGVIEKHNGSYVIGDVFFREWIRKKI
jgi:hypothetical protein